MEKIKITEEQEKALKYWKDNQEEFNSFIKGRESYIRSYKPLNDFTPEQFALLLCGWYEVEQPFKVGDWVYNKANDLYQKVSSKCMSDFLENNEISISFVLTNTIFLEKVTEPWKIMLLELGRDKPEFKVGDKYTTSKRGFHTVDTSNCRMHEDRFNRGEVTHFYPVESRIEVKR